MYQHNLCEGEHNLLVLCRTWYVVWCYAAAPPFGRPGTPPVRCCNLQCTIQHRVLYVWMKITVITGGEKKLLATSKKRHDTNQGTKGSFPNKEEEDDDENSTKHSEWWLKRTTKQDEFSTSSSKKFYWFWVSVEVHIQNLKEVHKRRNNKNQIIK